jgi:monothiol glutaredoxin
LTPGARRSNTSGMTRHVLPEARIHPSIREKISEHHRDLVDEVRAAVAAHDVVVVGMAQNPFPRKAKKLLGERKVAFHYLEYGSYLSLWRRRNALKMWTGWPTFPMIFVKGTFVGGADDLAALAASGELDRLLAAPRDEAAAM